MANGFMSTPKKRFVATAVFFALAMVAGGVLGYIQNSREISGASPEEMIWYFVPGALVLAGLSYWFGAVWMKSIDEAAQEAHKWSWYWGGSAGLGVAMVAYFLSFMPEARHWDIPTLMGRTDPVAYAVTGGVIVIGLLIVGYSVAWAFWWLQRR